ncbi:hypothetical protein TNCV_1028021 [Trichonephila clavipes]|nr:hypothetical protein TNCV_1028021 [Trichonephila clavipes]
MANLGDQFLPPTNLGRVDEEMVPPGQPIESFLTCNRHPIAVHPLYLSVPTTTLLDFFPPKTSGDSTHDAEVIPLPFLVIQSDCLHPFSPRKTSFPLRTIHNSCTIHLQIGEEGSALIHIPKTSIEESDEGERILEKAWLVTPRRSVAYCSTRLRTKGPPCWILCD